MHAQADPDESPRVIPCAAQEPVLQDELSREHLSPPLSLSVGSRMPGHHDAERGTNPGSAHGCSTAENKMLL